MQSKEDIVKRWSVSAPFWEKYHETIRQMFAPITQALVEGAQIRIGNKVLDVATGSGEPALTLAALVGPAGSVIGVDPIPDMIAGARRAADRAKLKNIEFEIAFADRLPFADRTFDAAVSRFGAMFFPSPVDGIGEILRVVKPKGKLALAVWSFADRNPFHYSLSRVMDCFVAPAPPAPDAPDMFRFAAPGNLLEILVQAGATNPVERVFQFKIRASLSAEQFWALRKEMSETLREKIVKLSAIQGTELDRQAIESLREYSTDGGMSFPAEVLIVTGSKC